MPRTSSLRNAAIIIALSFLLVAGIAVTFSMPAVPLPWRRLRHSTDLLSPYQAPLTACQWGDAIDKNYIVFLHYGSSLDKHIQTVNREQAATLDEAHMRHIWPQEGRYRYGLIYVAEDVDRQTLDAIRADVTVDLVECNRKPTVSIFDGEEFGEVFTYDRSLQQRDL